MNFKIEKTEIKAKSRKFIFGNIPVCCDCGQWVHRDTKCCNGNVEPLKAYYERVYKKPFIEEQWKWEVSDDLTNLHGVDVEKELVDTIKHEAENELSD